MAVYFVQSGKRGRIKIGHTKKGIQRIEELQCGHPQKLMLIGVISGGCEKEREIHKRFAEYRIIGEWFKPSASLLDFISSLPKSTIAQIIKEERLMEGDMPPGKTPVSQLADLFGGRVSLAKEMKVSLSLLRKWEVRDTVTHKIGRIPPRYNQRILDMALRLKVSRGKVMQLLDRHVCPLCERRMSPEQAVRSQVLEQILADRMQDRKSVNPQVLERLREGK